MMERDASVSLNSNFFVNIFVTSLFVIYILSIYTEVKKIVGQLMSGERRCQLY